MWTIEEAQKMYLTKLTEMLHFVKEMCKNPCLSQETEPWIEEHEWDWTSLSLVNEAKTKQKRFTSSLKETGKHDYRIWLGHLKAVALYSHLVSSLDLEPHNFKQRNILTSKWHLSVYDTIRF